MKSLIFIFLMLVSFNIFAAEATGQCKQIPLLDNDIRFLTDIADNMLAYCDIALKKIVDNHIAKKIEAACKTSQRTISEYRSCSQDCQPITTVKIKDELEEFPIYDKTDCTPGSEHYKSLFGLLKKQIEDAEKREESLFERLKLECSKKENPIVVTAPPTSYDGGGKCDSKNFYDKWMSEQRIPLNQKIAAEERSAGELLFKARVKADKDRLDAANNTPEAKAKKQAEDEKAIIAFNKRKAESDAQQKIIDANLIHDRDAAMQIENQTKEKQQQETRVQAAKYKNCFESTSQNMGTMNLACKKSGFTDSFSCSSAFPNCK
jgi:hypothetical protein